MEELGLVSGYYLLDDTCITDTTPVRTKNTNQNVCATEKQARSILAFCQLTQLMKDYYEQIKFDPSKTSDTCFSLTLNDYAQICVTNNFQKKGIFVFKTEDHALTFGSAHKDLLNQYFML